MIAELEDVSMDLGEKKAKIDRVIQTLMMEENYNVAQGEQEEKEDDEAGSADAIAISGATVKDSVGGRKKAR
ncbi:hypothetical protein A2U01_0108820, partial [Trifolium medium]|nr:hypothetical protein [Trifolium medium]